MWVLGLSYASNQLTDGYVPRHLVNGRPRWRMLAAELVRFGLWSDAHDGGWHICDYLKWNRPREEVLSERRAGAERQRRFRKRHP
jgi:hypothetical protein